MSRQTKFTPELGKRACEFRERGLSRQRIPGKIGVARSTFYAWLEKGTAEGAEDSDPQLAEWALHFLEAEANFELALVDTVRAPKASGPKRRGAMFLLERQFQDEYRLRQTLEHTGPNGGPVQQSFNVDPLALAGRITTLGAGLARRDAGGDAGGSTPGAEPGGAGVPREGA